jgi:ABC-type cobalamin/Fe3+-siderophores transport system ATPase subunit
MNMIGEFNRQLGMTIVMVTHERALAERYAQRLIFLADGKLVRDESISAAIAGNAMDRARAEEERR